MSIFDINQVFTASMDVRNLTYIRNYNFNVDTVSNLPLYMKNTGEEIPITVNITTTYPWVRIFDIDTSEDITYPLGNVVLLPNTEKTLAVRVDLPLEIEAVQEINVQPKPVIRLKAVSGSFPISRIPTTTPDDEQQSAGRIVFISEDEISVDEITITAGETIEIPFMVFDVNGNQKFSSDFSITSDSSNIASVKINKVVVENGYPPMVITGLSGGSTTIRVRVDSVYANLIVNVIPVIVPTTPTTPPRPRNPGTEIDNE